MEREDEVIDLGAVSVETLGPPGNKLEFAVIGHVLGITDDE